MITNERTFHKRSHDIEVNNYSSMYSLVNVKQLKRVNLRPVLCTKYNVRKRT